MSTQYLIPKASTETVAYTFNWAQELPNDDISSFTLTVASGTVTLTNKDNTDKLVSVLIAGGADGETAQLALEITTTGGQILKRTIYLLISNTAAAIAPSTITKRAVCVMAFEEIGLAGYEFDATPEEYNATMRRMDALMAEWRGPGVKIDLGYNFPPTLGAGDLDDESGIPDAALNIVAMNVALRIMPIIGKTMAVESKVAMAQGLNALRATYAVIPERSLPRSTIRGAGNKPWTVWYPFITEVVA